MAHPDLAAERAYLDHAYESRPTTSLTVVHSRPLPAEPGGL